ncbi:MAG: hypothetical protein AAF411_04660 [Myxococcota bacterium]
MDRLIATENARVVTVSSLMHRLGRIHFDDLHFRRRTYRTWPTYAQSKLANLLFALELQRWFETHGLGVRSLAAHPGWTSTELQRHTGFVQAMTRVLAMKPLDGAMPTLRAALDRNAAGGQYYGPDGFLEARGRPKPAVISAAAQDRESAARLWTLSEGLSNVRFRRPEAEPAHALA